MRRDRGASVRPSAASTVHPGEMTTVVYEVVNTQARTVKAQAIPSYAPQSAMPHFKKVECFCFKEQTLGRTRRARCRWCSSSTRRCRAK
jgi:cytochrome c oxidase assembly protein Cox11